MSQELIEAIAKIVYDAMPFYSTTFKPLKPEWVDGGNSFRQDDARKAASAILSLPRISKVMEDLNAAEAANEELEELVGEARAVKLADAYNAESAEHRIAELNATIAKQAAALEAARKALAPFAIAASAFSFAIGPDDIDDGLVVVARAAVRPGREVELSTTDFSTAVSALSQLNEVLK